MDWLLATPQIHSAFSSLGSLEGDTYVVSPNALSILEEINYKLNYEDQTLRTFRRAIGFSQNVRSDLIPLLENAKDADVLDAVIRILVNLTVPVECLFSVDVMYRTEVGRHTIFDLNKLLYTSKEAFTDPKSTKSVVEYMKHILESDSKLSPEKCDKINNCLLLLRNILHIPETNANFLVPVIHVQSNGVHAVSMQNAILWNLFIQSIDKLLLYLMTSPQRSFWGVTMVQLIALMYKDQHVSTLQKLLNLWFEASISESSEDNESNTSPPKQGSGDSSPMLTSDPTSDSSDNGKCSNRTTLSILRMHARSTGYFEHAYIPIGSGGCKNESSEDRRQALREETEATLQEVSRKGQEYQNSMFSEPSDKLDSSEAASDVGGAESDEQFATVQATNIPDDEELMATNIIFKEEDEEEEEQEEEEEGENEEEEAMEAIEDEEGVISDATVIDPIKSEDGIGKTNTKQNKLPADIDTNTTTSIIKSTDDDAIKFKPPPLLPVRATTSTLAVKMSAMESLDDEQIDEPPKPCQKVPHSGQLHLTKGKCGPQKRECPSSQSELSDCGYGTQVENQESISTSSNDDDGPQQKPQHQKPPCGSKSRNKPRAVLTPVDKKELRRKKLVKRSKSSLINMKGLVQHTPTDEDISNLLKEFTVDFLLKGYDYLVDELHSLLLTNLKIPIDTSHFFWLVTYFLKFAAQLELDMEHINSILTYDVISYLTYEGVALCEQLELNSRQEGCDLKPYLRRMHLVVTAIREFLQAIETYKKVTHLSEDDREHLRNLQIQISSTEDLRNLFVLLLRRFNPSLHTKQYLQDLVVTNHILLLILDSVTQSDSNANIKMVDHISQFATLEMMHYYGILLEDFSNNGEFVNNCIFTMMHHIGGDLGQISALFQPIILKTYSRIWEADYELCDDWSDLIEYVIHKFMNTPQKSQLTLPTASLTELTKEHNLENTVCTWTQEEMDTLYWYYVQSKKNNDVVGKIVKLFSNNGNKHKSRISIIQQLLQQDIITLVEYDDLMKFEDAEYQRALLTTPTSCTTESGIDLKDSTGYVKPSDDIQILRDFIIKENKEKHLVWLQKILLECCYVKFILKNSLLRKDHQNLDHVMEPVAYHCILKNKSIPVVQWNNDQATTMLYQPFVLLLHKLGFQLPADAGSVFARIPDYWTAETMYGLAKKLGPLDKLLIKFDTSNLEIGAEVDANIARCHHISAARNSLSSVSSLDVEIADGDDLPTVSGPLHRTNILTPVSELDIKTEKATACEIFAVPKTKHSNSIIRFIPEPTPVPTVPNWLQLVMRSKCNLRTNMSNAMPLAPIITTNADDKNNVDVVMTSNNVAPILMTSATPSGTLIPHLMGQPTLATATVTASAPTAPLNTVTTFTRQTITNTVSLNNEQKSCNNTINGSNNMSAAGNNNNSYNGNNNNSNISINTLTATSTSSSPTPSTSTAAAAHALAVTLKEQQQQLQQQQQQQQHQQQQHQHQHVVNMTDDDAAMKSLERNGNGNDSNANGFHTRCAGGNGKLDRNSEYSAMVAAVYETEIANSDSASVASDLTRMYVSDEDEKHEYRTPHYI